MVLMIATRGTLCFHTAALVALITIIQAAESNVQGDKASSGRPGQDKAGQDNAGQDRAGQGRAGQGRV